MLRRSLNIDTTGRTEPINVVYRLLPDKGDLIYNYPERILDSWPQIPQHYENGVSKNR